jgi:hypothetical protein
MRPTGSLLFFALCSMTVFYSTLQATAWNQGLRYHRGFPHRSVEGFMIIRALGCSEFMEFPDTSLWEAIDMVVMFQPCNGQALRPWDVWVEFVLHLRSGPPSALWCNFISCAGTMTATPTTACPVCIFLSLNRDSGTIAIAYIDQNPTLCNCFGWIRINSRN